MCDVHHLESGPFKVKDEPGADKVRPCHALPTIFGVNCNRLSCQFLDLGDFIQSIHHHELGNAGFRAYRNQNVHRLSRGR